MELKKLNSKKLLIWFAVILSLVTIFFALVISRGDVRTVLTAMKYCMITIALFYLSIVTISHTRSKKIKILIFSFLILYSIYYITGALTFLSTGQIIGLQLIIFLYKTTIYWLLFPAIGGILLSSILLSYFLVEKVLYFPELNLCNKKKILYIFLTLIVIYFLAFVGSRFEDKIVRDYPKNFQPIAIEGTSGERLMLPPLENNYSNIIFIMLESVSANKVYPSRDSYRGGEIIAPNVRELYEQGVVFENAYSVSTHSDYAQPAVLSSNHILRNNLRNFFTSPANQNAIWQVFKEKGYETFYFSSQDDYWAGMHTYFNYSSLDEYWFSETDDFHDYGFGLWKKDYDDYTLEKALTRLKNKIEEDKNIEDIKPFFLYLNFQATHSPYEIPEGMTYNFDSIEGLEEYTPSNIKTINQYDSALRYVDSQVGTLLSFLNVTGFRNNTLIVLSSDHGHNLYENHNLQGHGLSVYDEETKVPLIFIYPNSSHKVISDRVTHLDVLPTIIDLFNWSQKEEFRGRPFEKDRRIFFYVQSHRYIIGMIEGNLKTIIDMNKNLVEVYDLKKDSLELNNLVNKGDYSKQVDTLLTWHYCQLNYFSRDFPKEGLEEYCEVFRN